MSGFILSRGATGAVLAAASLAAPIALGPSAHAAIAPELSMSMTGSVLSAVHAAAIGCRETAQATLKNPDGSPVSHGTVDFFSHLADMSGNIVGTVPVSNGVASIAWAPGLSGEHVVSAVYYGGEPDYQPVADYIVVTVLPIAGICV
jgi:hypothetical protein